jgi:hypothetical protein
VLQNFLWHQTADRFLDTIENKETAEQCIRLPHQLSPVKLGGSVLTIHELNKIRTDRSLQKA